jgi:hypothetical protein
MMISHLWVRRRRVLFIVMVVLRINGRAIKMAVMRRMRRVVVLGSINAWILIGRRIFLTPAACFVASRLSALGGSVWSSTVRP